MLSIGMFCIGSIIGSFLNVCICRLPQNRSMIFPSSHCLWCNTSLRPCDLIPIASYLLLRGKCRYCGKPYSARYAVVELLTGLLFLWCFQVIGLGPELVKIVIFTSFLVVISFIDYDYQLILDKVLVWFIGAGVFVNLFIGYPRIWDMIIAAVVGGGFLLVLSIITCGGIGDGDTKFIAALGLWLGLEPTILTLFLSFVIGGFGSVLLLVLKQKTRRDFIPFGPFIAIAALISALYGVEIIQWYLQSFI